MGLDADDTLAAIVRVPKDDSPNGGDQSAETTEV
jgi:hypothetical protein